ncbi:hypothetical protein [Allonocardiopsis opalescens]|uniref:Secreted protein n=1 Tax=Allonocardiopsis opalescens TaxID=1144618 RepID=A0A2T0Q2P6_9ACTN|nr:hypothetical protein [Allonocardiopsis opalescens]PRX98059.1 hypothetical protein CLV72_105412 [Allonocardiopsis opalescens]
MNVPARLGLYGLGLAAAFGGAVAVGTVAAPLLPAAAAPEQAAHDAAGDGGHGAAPEADEHGDGHGSGGTGAPVPSGLQISAEGYTLDLVERPADGGELAYRVLGPDGEPVTRFDVSHDERMHLIVVGRDMTGFRHVHPEMADDGTWSIPMEPGDPGAYRMFADFVPTGDDPLTLGADLLVPGESEPRPLPEPRRTAEVDGYTVTLEGELVPGRTSELTLSVSRGGEPVTDLEPYLGAYGHLVALRDGDLAYLHVHPDGTPGDGGTEPGPEITFQAEVPSTGHYRLFLDFQHGGEVRTAEFTAAAEGTVPLDPGASSGTEHADDGHTH